MALANIGENRIGERLVLLSLQGNQVLTRLYDIKKVWWSLLDVLEISHWHELQPQRNTSILIMPCALWYLFVLQFPSEICKLVHEEKALEPVLKFLLKKFPNWESKVSSLACPLFCFRGFEEANVHNV